MEVTMNTFAWVVGLVIWLVLTIPVGGRMSNSKTRTLYQKVQEKIREKRQGKPIVNVFPPSVVFGPIWIINYTLIAISFVLWITKHQAPDSNFAHNPEDLDDSSSFSSINTTASSFINSENSLFEMFEFKTRIANSAWALLVAFSILLGLWSMFFFTMRSPIMAAVDCFLSLLAGTGLLLVFIFGPDPFPTASVVLLSIPLVWIFYATFLSCWVAAHLSAREMRALEPAFAPWYKSLESRDNMSEAGSMLLDERTNGNRTGTF